MTTTIRSTATTAGDSTGVIVVARDVPYGTAVTADDLTVAQVSVDPVVRTIPADDGHGAAPLPVPSVPGARRRRRRRLLCFGLWSSLRISDDGSCRSGGDEYLQLADAEGRR